MRSAALTTAIMIAFYQGVAPHILINNNFSEEYAASVFELKA
jgi:hypothetical protein